LNNIGISLSPNYFPFYISSTTCGGSLAAGTSCTITVAILSGADYSCGNVSLVVNDSANNSPQSVGICDDGFPQ
jgi:hypothetical protein